jgi:S1-C subfamily serine protease
VQGDLSKIGEVCVTQRGVIGLWCLIVLALPDVSLAQTCTATESITSTSFGQWFDPSITLNSNQTSQSFDSGLPNISSLKLFLGAKKTEHSWNIVIRDGQYHVLATFGSKEFGADGAGREKGRWTGRLPSSQVIVDLIAPNEPNAAVDVIAGIALPSSSSATRLFSIQGQTPKWQPLYKSSSATEKRAGDAVGMLVGAAVLDDGQKYSWCCSGVEVTSDLFLTNWHCGGAQGMPEKAYWNTDVCNNTVVDLGWDDGLISRQYSCADVVATDKRLDFALLRLRPVVGPGGTVGEPVRAQWGGDQIGAVSNIFMLHHAQCLPKLTSGSCHVISTSIPAWTNDEGGAGAPASGRRDPFPVFTHDCDTEPGASGGPIFDFRGKLVGLHHAGFARDAQCHAIDSVNKAIKIDAILEFLRDSRPALSSELTSAN